MRILGTAWGSIIAIVAAIWIAHKATETSQRLAAEQAALTREAYERARIERHLEQLGPVPELFDAALTELEHVRMLALTMDVRNECAVDSKVLDQLKLVRAALDSIPVHSMPTAATAGSPLSERALLGNASAELDEFVTRAGLMQPHTEEQDRAFNEAIRLVQQERDRMHLAPLALVEPAARHKTAA